MKDPSRKVEVNHPMVDLHNHMLPGLDDGACNWEESMVMARMAVEDGIEEVVCTPHWVSGCYDNTRSIVFDALKELQDRLSDHGIPLKVYPGSELHLDFDLPRKIESRELLTLNDTGRFALIELTDGILPQNLDAFFQDLQALDVTPIIGHPERNRALIEDPARLYNWVEMGILTQITAASLLGRFGTQIEKFSIRLLKHHLVHIVASDAHRSRSRTPKLSEGYQVVENILGKELAYQMTYETPKRIILGEPVTTMEPLPMEIRSSGFLSWKRFFSFSK